MKKRNRRNLKKEFVKFYTPDNIGMLDNVFYGPGWYEFIKYIDLNGNQTLPLQLNLNGVTIYYEEGTIPSLTAPLDKPIYYLGQPIRWWSTEEIRENNLNELLNPNINKIEDHLWFV